MPTRSSSPTTMRPGPLFERAGVIIDDVPGYLRLDGSRKTADAFIATCRGVRSWDREI